MRQVLIMAAALLALTGCSYISGIIRRAPVVAWPDKDCVQTALASFAPIRLSQPAPQHDPPPTSFPFTLANDPDVQGLVWFAAKGRNNATPDAIVLMVSRPLGRPGPSQADVDAWRPMLDGLQARLAQACDVPELAAPLAETCLLGVPPGRKQCAPTPAQEPARV